MLQDRQGPLVVGPAHEDLAQQTEAAAVVAVGLDHLEQLCLRLLPLVQHGEGAGDHDAAVEALGRELEPARTDVDRVARAPEREQSFAQGDKSPPGVAPEGVVQLLELFRAGGWASGLNHPRRNNKLKPTQAAM